MAEDVEHVSGAYHPLVSFMGGEDIALNPGSPPLCSCMTLGKWCDPSSLSIPISKVGTMGPRGYFEAGVIKEHLARSRYMFNECFSPSAWLPVTVIGCLLIALPERPSLEAWENGQASQFPVLCVH